MSADLPFLCARCRNVMPGLSCGCGFTVPASGGILDFISNDPACNALQEEIETWDEDVSAYETSKLREQIVDVAGYFRGLGEHRSAARMLPAMGQLDLRGKRCLEVGGVGHCLAMMLKSGCTDLYHLEVSAESQRLAMRNLAALPETSGAAIRYLQAPAEKIPLPDASVDFLMALGTYHHTDRRLSVPEIHRVLKPGGFFYFHEGYIGTALLPFKWLTRAARKPFGFHPGNDNPLGRADLAILNRHFPVHRFEIRNVLDIAAFAVRYVSPALGRRMYRAEMNLPGVTAVGIDFLKGTVHYSGQRTT